ncbi:hypothetical protein AB4082_10360, partial [Vibrio cyclitrophicus]
MSLFSKVKCPFSSSPLGLIDIGKRYGHNNMLVTMSDSEINRFKVIEDVCQRRIRRAVAAEILSLSVRHIQRLM